MGNYRIIQTFQHEVTGAEATAGTLDIDVKLEPLPTDDLYYIVQVVRAGEVVAEDVAVSYAKATGKLTIADGSTTFVLTAGDVITVFTNFAK